MSERDMRIGIICTISCILGVVYGLSSSSPKRRSPRKSSSSTGSTSSTSSTSRTKVVLVDMDGVLCDFDERAFDLIRERRAESEKARQALPDLQDMRPADMTKFPLAANFPSRFSDAIIALFFEEGFFASLGAVEGAVAALKEMALHPDVDGVFICTAPIAGSKYCHQEKVEWVRSKLGDDWVRRMVICSDKSLVRGDILIDDAPKAKAKAMKPVWEHVWFKRPYNAHLGGEAAGRQPRQRHLETWADWRSVVLK